MASLDFQQQDLCNPEYLIRYYDRGGLAYDSPQNISNLKWGRKLDGISFAEITYFISDDSCCDQLGSIEPIAHEVGIARNGKLVWYGWVLNVEYGRNHVRVEAFDALGWLKKRLVHNDLTFTGVELSQQFLSIWNDAMAPSPIRAEVITTPTGITETREIKAADNRIAWSPVQEMLDTGLDVTVYGQKVLAGVIYSTRSIELSLADVEGDATVTKLGNGYANRVIVDADESVQAVYPPNQISPAGNDLYPLAEEVIRDSQIQDVGTAEHAAKSRYEYSRRVPRIVDTSQAMVLHSNIDITVNELVPGVRVIFDTEGICYGTKYELRLSSVDVEVAESVERISINLQPTGPRDALADSEGEIQ